MASLARSRKHLVMNPLARLLRRLQVPKGLSVWAEQEAWMRPQGFYLLALVLPELWLGPWGSRDRCDARCCPLHPQVRSRPSASSPFPLPRGPPDARKEEADPLWQRKGPHLSNPGPCNCANRPANCTKSLEAPCLRAHGGWAGRWDWIKMRRLANRFCPRAGFNEPVPNELFLQLASGLNRWGRVSAKFLIGFALVLWESEQWRVQKLDHESFTRVDGCPSCQPEQERPGC